MRTFAEYTKNLGQHIGRDPESFLAEVKNIISLEVWDEDIGDYPTTFSLFVQSLIAHLY